MALIPWYIVAFSFILKFITDELIMQIGGGGGKLGNKIDLSAGWNYF